MSGRLLFRIAASMVAAIAIVLPVSGCSSGDQSPDLNKRGDSVNAVMHAIHSSDAQKLAALAGPGPADPADAAPLLDKWGGASDQGFTVRYMEVVSLGAVPTRVDTLDKAGNPVEVEFQLNWHDGRWLLGIGHAPTPAGMSRPAKPGG